MKRIVFFIACIVLALASVSFAKSNQEPLDKMVAIVNDDVITRSELDRAIATAKMQMASENIPAPANSTLEKQVLEQLINKKLQLQVAKQNGINIGNDEVDRAVNTIATKNNVTVADLYDRLSEEGMTTAEYRSEIHDQILLQKLQQQEIAGKISVTPQEITQFSKSQVWQKNDSKEYRLENIVIPLPDAPTPEQIAVAKKRAAEIIAKANAGKNFRALAQVESTGSNALEGGDLGFRKLPEIPTAFANQVLHMQKNEIAGPIQTANGLHIIRLADVRTTANTAETTTPNRKTIENMLLQKKFEEAMQTWVSKLRSQAFIETNTHKA